LIQRVFNLFIFATAIVRSDKIINLLFYFVSDFKMPKANSPPTSPMAELGLTVKSQYKPSLDLSAAIFAAKERYIQGNSNSAKLFEEATRYLPGGNTRTLLYSAPFPLCMKKGEGYKVFDEDDHV
jgi:glutamate-1-semialdehyde 2,1-aminomutase